MRSVNMHEAKTHLSKLVKEAARGESFTIAIAGKPMVKVVPLDAMQEGEAAPVTRRFGFAADRFASGEWRVPDDIKGFMREEIEEMFYGGELFPPVEPE